jgi:hypothetical protein
MRNVQPETQSVFSEIRKVLQLCLSQSTSAATAERTFSGLRRSKTWVRNTMTQKRLTHLAVMHVNKDILDHYEEMLPHGNLCKC